VGPSGSGPPPGRETVNDASRDAPAAASRAFESVMADCLARLEAGDDGGVEWVAAAHPEHAAELRRRLAVLGQAGFLRQGRRVGHYRLLGTLGRGGMGVVSLARDERLGRVVALKTLPGRLVDTPRARARFEREVRAAASLRHDHIVPVHDAGEDEDGTAYFVMEYVEGRTLSDVVAELRERPDAPGGLRADDLIPGGSSSTPSRRSSSRAASTDYARAAVAIVRDVASALSHAHERGVVHRDVKPSNVLLRDDGHALLFDFGLARLDAEAPLTLSGDFAGTPHYAPPEQLTRGEVDARSDVYSLGATFYELLTTRRPFEGSSMEELTRDIVDREPEPLRRRLPGLPRDLETIVLTALEKEPSRRYASAAAMAGDLDRFLSGDAILARPQGRLARGVRWVSRHRAVTAVIVLLALIAVGAPLLQRRSARLLREEARKQDRVLDFLNDVIFASDVVERDPETTVATLMERAGAKLDGGTYDDDPATEAALRQLVALGLSGLGLFDESERHSRRAVELNRALHAGGDHRDLAEVVTHLAGLRQSQGDLDEAHRLYGEALELWRRLEGVGSWYLLYGLDLARVELSRGEPDAALARTEETLRLLEEEADVSPYVRGGVLAAAAVIHRDLGDDVRNAELLERAIESQMRASAENHAQLSTLHRRLMDATRALGDLERAEQAGRAAVADALAWVGPDHLITALCRAELARVLANRATGTADAEAWAEVDEMYGDALVVLRRTHPQGSEPLASALYHQAAAFTHQGRFGSALAPAEEALGVYLQVDDPLDDSVQNSMLALARLYAHLRRDEEAERLLLTFTPVLERLPEDDPRRRAWRERLDAVRRQAAEREVGG